MENIIDNSQSDMTILSSADLQKYGIDGTMWLNDLYKREFLKLVFNDPEWGAENVLKFNVNYMNSPDGKTSCDADFKALVGKLQSIVKFTGKIPSVDEFKMINLENNSNALEAETENAYLDTIGKESEADPRFIKESFDKFCKQYQLAAFVSRAANLVRSKGGFALDEIGAAFEDCLKKVDPQNQRFTPPTRIFDNFDSLFERDEKDFMPSGIDKLDECCNGGLERGKMAVVIGAAGYGKTTMTTSIAQSSALSGRKVMQIVFEDQVADIQRKHLSRLCSINGNEIEAMNVYAEKESITATLQDHRDQAKALSQNLMVKKFSPNTMRVSDIRRFIESEIAKGFAADTVIIDYFECIIPTNTLKSTNEWKAEAETMREIERMANELNIAVWLPTQGGRSAFDSDSVGMGNVQGSITKVQIGHVILSIARTEQMIANNQAKISILKNRSGKSGVSFGLYFNNGTSIIKDGADLDDRMLSYDEIFEEDDDTFGKTRAIVEGVLQGVEGVPQDINVIKGRINKGMADLGIQPLAKLMRNYLNPRGWTSEKVQGNLYIFKRYNLYPTANTLA